YPCPKWLSEIKTKLKKEIKGLSEREYNMLITQFFDLFTYRIDAWFMAILHYKYYSFGQLNYYRFVQLNGYAPQKFFYLDAPKIGAFGWVFNLKEKTRREIANKASIVNQMNLKDAQSPIYKNYDSDSDEYIMAPSVQHAITAAILRSSHRNSKSAVDEHRMSVNLSSMRARQALRLIDGIKSGMSTGVVLGIDLEGYMHNAYKAEFEGEYCEMSQYIYPLRKLFPQTIDIEAEDKRADNYVMQVINGEAILNTFKDKWNYQGSVFDYLCNNYSQMPELSWTANLFGNNHNHLRCLFKLIERMADSYDALSDLLLSEGVYRLVQGNRSAFASIINFMSKGSGNLPEPVILNTPMEHVVSQYRVGIALPECKQIIQRPMCIGEPSVNLWLEQMMGKSDNIYFIIKKKIEDKNIYEKCYLSEIDLNPIEYLYLSSDEDLFFTYLGMQYRLKNNNFTDELTILNSEPEVFEENDIREYELKNEDFSLFENELRINNLRSLILQSHSMKANDWIAQPTSDSEEENTIDINELKFRYESLVNYAKSLNLQMISLKNNLKEDYITDETLIEMSKLLSKNIEMGLTSSLSGFKIAMFADDIDKVANRPMFDRAVDLQQTFLQSFEFVQTQLEKRIEEVEEIIRQKDPSLFSSELYISAMQKLLLDTFKVYTRFTIHPATSIEQRESYNKILQQGVSHYKNISEMSFEEWTNDVAEVRDGMKKWNYIRMFENMCGNDLGKASIIQMKSEGDVSLDEWLGCEVSSESVLDDVDSLVIYNSENINIKHDTTYNSGIMIDSWLEYIPYKKQAAGMVFHCDQPDAEAPQTLLLAISPEFDFKYTKRWSLNNLIELVEETRFLAMNRAVEPDHIYKDSILSAILPLFSKKND
ncbi:hypothetical protein LJC69_06460, partial [Bacteroidales bacterium OttesenSCG-928-K22]|nr:hypothetical protein [Bacteroidales bacterium OttesenSCG-928-K22]